MSKYEYLNNLKNLSNQNRSREKVLGKGISALISNKKDFIDNNKHKLVDIELKSIIASKFQPRKTFNDEQLQELSNSIKQKGVLQPILLRKVADNNEYELIAGERRVRASILANLTTIPAIVLDISDQQSLEIGLIENLQRENLNPIEEALSFKKLIQKFNYTHNDIATILGKNRTYITNYLRILTLPKEIQDLIAAKKISVGHAKIIINYEFPMELAKEIISKNLTVREVEEIVKSKKNPTKTLTRPYINDEFTINLNKQIQNIFKNCKVTVKTNNNGSGCIKINFKDKKYLPTFNEQ